MVKLSTSSNYGLKRNSKTTEMSDNRLSKLGILLESKNRALRQEAVGILSKLPFTNSNLATIHNFLKNPSWDARVAASEALAGILKNVPKPEQPSVVSVECGQRLQMLSLFDVVTSYQPLVSCETDVLEAKSPVVLSSRDQRNLIDQHLDFNAKVGISSRNFLSDDEIQLAMSTSQNRAQENKQVLAKKSSECEADANESDEIDHVLVEFIQRLLQDLADQKWQNRHGGALALQKIIIHVFNRLADNLVENITIRIFEVLALDKFNDFMTGSNAIAPVRESAAQCLCLLIAKIPQNTLIYSSILKHLKDLLSMSDERLWLCRQTALIVFKYYFSITAYSQEFMEMFENVVGKMNDPVDEVASAAVLALSALFANSKITKEELRNFVATVMDSVWNMLKTQENQAQLKEGVNSLLVDLLKIIELWLKVDETSNLDNEQFLLIIDLFDQNFISRTSQAMLCILLAISKRPDLNNEVLYKLVKMLYRVLIFVQPSDSSELLTLCLSTLAKLIEFYEDDIPTITSFQQSIGFWLGCLILEHKKAELDVFIHCVDGPSSSQTSPVESFCSEEMRFLNDQEKANVFIERKILAARFLSPIINAMYKSGVVVVEQPLYLSIQLVFVQILRSTSMYQRLGAALALNCWARIYRRTTAREDLKQPLEYPTLIIKEIEKCVWTPVEVYDEVGSIINFLTSECNEFRQYCIRKGAKKDELPVMNENTSMEDMIRACYELSVKKCKQEDLPALNSRLAYMEDLINNTKNGIRINSNRINALLSSALFYFGYVPEKLTPMIRPLIECTDSEVNSKVAEEILYDAMPLLLSYTCQRTPCPHPKIIKQLCNGLISCKNYVPDPSLWSAAEKELIIISTSQNIEEKGLKSKNCRMVIQAICDHFGVNILGIVPDMKTYLALKKDEDFEQYLLNLEVVRAVSPRLKNIPTEQEAEILGKYLSHKNPAIRFRIARCIAMFAQIDLGIILNFLYQKICQNLSNIESDHERCGAIELIYLLSGLEQGLIGATSLLAPLALSSIGDKVDQVRETAAMTFRKLITLLPLEHQDRRILPNLNETLLKKYHESLDFLNVLSCPGNLPMLTKENIPGLIDDINLRSYQLEGITWMMFLNRFGLNGILADDMGLGKTLQTLCLIAIQLHAQETPPPSLIVCPKTLVNHWCNEWRKYFPQERPIRHIETGIFGGRVSQVVVISYDEVKHHFHTLNNIRWHYIILDEGHCIRNPTTQLFEAITSLVSKHRLILSGTPVQNSPADLWALFRFLMPGYLSTKAAFHSRFMKSILACRSHKASEQQTKDGEEALNQLHRQVLPFILRRLKSDVLSELPEKVVQDYMCQLTDVQRKLYELVVDRCSLKRDNKIDNGESPRLSALHTLIALRKLVDHPILIDDVLNLTGDKDVFNSSLPQNQTVEMSGKMLALRELLSECQIGRDSKSEASGESSEDLGVDVPAFSGHKALIFCQWRASIELIARFIENGDLGADIDYLRLDGTVPPNDRQAVVDRFNNDPSIELLLLSTHIGGVGLTLTGADVVIFVDHDWNPVKDLQAIDRAHRLGQKRVVNVYRLITAGSIEEKIMRYQKFKSDTANALVGSDNRSISSMATDELMELFSLDTSDKGGASNSDSGPAPKKRKAAISGALAGGIGGEDKISLEELYDASQYEAQSSISSFVKSASK